MRNSIVTRSTALAATDANVFIRQTNSGSNGFCLMFFFSFVFLHYCRINERASAHKRINEAMRTLWIIDESYFATNCESNETNEREKSEAPRRLIQSAESNISIFRLIEATWKQSIDFNWMKQMSKRSVHMMSTMPSIGASLSMRRTWEDETKRMAKWMPTNEHWQHQELQRMPSNFRFRTKQLMQQFLINLILCTTSLVY